MARPSTITRYCAGRAIGGRRGFTLIESLIASVVLAFAVIGIAGTFAASHAQAAAHESNAIALSLARQLMEEISARPLVVTDTTPGWPGITDRATYDAINDYHGFSDTAPLNILGGSTTEIPDGYSRSVSLTYPAALFGGPVTAGDWVLISVTVREPVGRSVTLNKLVAARDGGAIN